MRRASATLPVTGGAAPAVVAVGAAVAAPLATGVGVGDLLLFIGHQLWFILIPGCLLYAGLSRRRLGVLRLLAVGSAAGYTLEVLSFAITAAIGIRGALWAYPAIVGAVGLLLLRRRARLEDPPELPLRGRLAWGLAALCAVAVAYVTFAYFLTSPLPSRVGDVAYLPDLVFHLSVAAEALHHWPITDPKVSGLALPYHTFVYMELAAVTQTTGISLPTVLFRLYLLPLVLLVIAQLYVAGTLISARRGVGVAAAALFLLVGQVGLNRRQPLDFNNSIFFSLYSSPPYVFGLAMFVPALILLYERLRSAAQDAGGWLLLALLLVGCSGAKASILPVMLGALVVYVLWQRLAMGDRQPAALAAVALVLVVFAVSYALLYRGESGGLAFNPPGTVRTMAPIVLAERSVAGSVGHPLFWVVASIVGLLGFCGPVLAGIPTAISSPTMRRARPTVLLLALVLASLAPFFAYFQLGGSQNFFTYYGLCAGCILSAQGLAALRDRAGHRFGAATAALAPAWLSLLLVAALVPYALDEHPRVGPLYGLWLGLPAAVVAALWLAGRRARTRGAGLTAMAAIALVLVGVLDTPLHLGSFVIGQLSSDRKLYATNSLDDFGLTPGLQQALAWVRHRTPTDAVLAVNNQYSSSGRRGPQFYYYSAFGERRIFLEGWYDTIPASRLGASAATVTPFPQRLRLNDAVFDDADAAALATMRRRYGVDYLLVDRVHGPDDPRLAKFGRTVFSNDSAVIYALPNR